MADMVLILCRDTNIKVLNILNEISKKEDVTEFITTVQLVQITINQLLKSKKEFKFEILKELQVQSLPLNFTLIVNDTICKLYFFERTLTEKDCTTRI